MRQALRFTLALVAGLALLTWGASVVVTRTTRAWFERDMQLRAQLAVSGARETLVSHWAAGQETELRKALVELTRDERVLGAAACGADLAPLARTIEYPAPLSCERLGPEVRLDAGSPAVAWTTWASVFSVPGGRVHATAIPVVAGDRPLGFVVLVHDLSFVERREATTTRFLVAGLRLPRARGVDHHRRRRAPLVAGLEQRAAAVDPGREAATGVPAVSPRRARARGAPRVGARGGRPGRPAGRRSGSRTR